MSFLKVEDLNKSFGGLKAVHHVDFEIEQGEILGLIGPNDQDKGSRGRYAPFIANFPDSSGMY